MIHTIRTAGHLSSALSYFAWTGVASIANVLSKEPVTVYWSSEAQSVGIVETSDVSLEKIALEIIHLATRWSEGWTGEIVDYSKGSFSPFSPRFKAINPDADSQDWINHQNARTQWLDHLEEVDDELARRLIHGLGEAAYWRFDGREPRPDHGASRWEMKTRNRGEEFIKNRFHPLCREISTWSVDELQDSLQGNKVSDTLNKNSTDSRTSTGLTPPGQADSALAFTALLGIGNFPITHRIHAMSVTPGAHPYSVLHPSWVILPIPTVPISSERFENIMLTAEWAAVVDAIGTNHGVPFVGDHFLAPTRTALKQWGIPAASVHRIHKGGTSSAPERYFEFGTVVLL